MQTVSQEHHPRDVGATATLGPVTVALVPSRARGWRGLAGLLPAALSFRLCRKDKDSAGGCLGELGADSSFSPLLTWSCL